MIFNLEKKGNIKKQHLKTEKKQETHIIGGKKDSQKGKTNGKQWTCPFAFFGIYRMG